MTERTGLKTTEPRHGAGRPRRKRRWPRWISVAVAAIVVLVVLGARAFIKFGPTAAPLALPAGTRAVTGTVVISGSRVTRATVRVDLAEITVSGKPQPQVATSLRTGQYPDATFTLAAPVTPSRAFAAGGAASLAAAGQLTMNGTTHQVTVSGSARRDGTTLQVAGSIPVTFSAWHIKAPAGFGFLGSLADHGTAEFLLTLRQP
jgi:polyisoprenoid-binding protein YceI